MEDFYLRELYEARDHHASALDEVDLFMDVERGGIKAGLVLAGIGVITAIATKKQKVGATMALTGVGLVVAAGASLFHDADKAVDLEVEVHRVNKQIEQYRAEVTSTTD